MVAEDDVFGSYFGFGVGAETSLFWRRLIDVPFAGPAVNIACADVDELCPVLEGGAGEVFRAGNVRAAVRLVYIGKVEGAVEDDVTPHDCFFGFIFVTYVACHDFAIESSGPGSFAEVAGKNAHVGVVLEDELFYEPAADESGASGNEHPFAIDSHEEVTTLLYSEGSGVWTLDGCI